MAVRQPMRIAFLEVLTSSDLDNLHADTLAVLEKTGVDVMHPASRRLLQGAGAKVEGNRARIPAEMVEDTLASVPKETTIYDRKGAEAMKLAPGHVYFGTGSDVLWITDPQTCERRKTDLDSIRMTTRLADALPNIDFVMSMGVAHGIPPERLDQHHFAAMVENTTKVIIFTSQSKRSVKDIAKMAAVVRGSEQDLRDKPFCMLYAMPTSPLVHTEEALDGLLVAAESGIPLIYSSGAMYGATGPVTTAGTLVVANAEMLSGLVIQQLHRPGAVFVHGPITGPMDMATTVNAYCGPRTMLAKVAETQLARYYNLPSFSLGGCSDSKLFDQQAAAEAAMTLTVSALAGANIIHDVGYLESGLHANPFLMTWCDEIIAQVRFMLRGLSVSAKDNLLDAIEEVGPGGHFLVHPSTVERFRDEMWTGELSDRRNYDEWNASGAEDAAERARKKTLEIIRTHTPDPLDENTLAEIWHIAKSPS